MIDQRWEFGGDFHQVSLPEADAFSWPAPATWYSLGRHCIVDLARFLGCDTVWVPDYFCYDVAEYWAQYVHLRWYEDDPRWPYPHWESLNPAENDIVIAVNYFASRSGEGWPQWHGCHACVLVEDHSHDVFGPWVQSSSSDFGFASIRKAYPVADGAVLWSPQVKCLPPQQKIQWTEPAERKQKAMALKAEYLAGRIEAGVKERFRKLQLSGEALLDKSEVQGPLPETSDLIRGGMPYSWYEQRHLNDEVLRRELHGVEGIEFLFSEYPQGAAPFGTVLLFDSRQVRDCIRQLLIQNRIYCPVHWISPESAPVRVRTLSSRILTICNDFRYSEDDMRIVAQFLKSLLCKPV